MPSLSPPPLGQYLGVIFDCDGTLADSMPIHYKAWEHALKKNGATFNFTFDLMCSWGGKGLAQTVHDLNTMFKAQLDVGAVLEDQAQYVEQYLPEVKPKLEVVAVAKSVAKHSPISVASGGHRHHVHTTLSAIGVSDLFDIVVTQDDVTHSKPAPDLFLLAAKRMGVAPTSCLVYEDSPTGVEAAQRAGMDVIDVTQIS